MPEHHYDQNVREPAFSYQCWTEEVHLKALKSHPNKNLGSRRSRHLAYGVLRANQTSWLQGLGLPRHDITLSEKDIRAPGIYCGSEAHSVFLRQASHASALHCETPSLP